MKWSALKLCHLFLAISTLLLFSVQPANAHKLQMFVTLEALSPQSNQTDAQATDFQLLGQVYFSASSPLIDAEITILSLENKLIRVLRSDKEGRFQWQLPSTAPFKIQCRSIDGHLVERIMTPQKPEHGTLSIKGQDVRSIDGKTHKLQQGGNIDAQNLRHIISSELTPLKEQISKLHHKVWLLEILGGLGVLFGGFGIWMFFLSKRVNLDKRDV